MFKVQAQDQVVVFHRFKLKRCQVVARCFRRQPQQAARWSTCPQARGAMMKWNQSRGSMVVELWITRRSLMNIYCLALNMVWSSVGRICRIICIDAEWPHWCVQEKYFLPCTRMADLTINHQWKPRTTSKFWERCSIMSQLRCQATPQALALPK